LTSELKLREYYKTVKIIDEEESDGSSKSGSNTQSNKFKSTSAKFLGNSNSDSSKPVFSSDGEEYKIDQKKKKNSIDIARFDMQPLMTRTNSTQLARFQEDKLNGPLKAGSYMRKPRTPVTPGKSKGKFNIDPKDPLATLELLESSRNRNRTFSGSGFFAVEETEVTIEDFEIGVNRKKIVNMIEHDEAAADGSLIATGSSKSSSSSSSSSSSVNFSL
jgi:hypothetical protein